MLNLTVWVGMAMTSLHSVTVAYTQTFKNSLKDNEEKYWDYQDQSHYSEICFLVDVCIWHYVKGGISDQSSTGKGI